MPNKDIQKAKQILEDISKDEHERYLAELRLKYIMDQKAIEDAGYDKGLAQGISQGLAKGLSQGISQGIKKNQKEIVKNMLAENIDINTISKVTKLSIEEIKKIANS